MFHYTVANKISVDVFLFKNIIFLEYKLNFIWDPDMFFEGWGNVVFCIKDVN